MLFNILFLLFKWAFEFDKYRIEYNGKVCRLSSHTKFFLSLFIFGPCFLKDIAIFYRTGRADLNISMMKRMVSKMCFAYKNLNMTNGYRIRIIFWLFSYYALVSLLTHSILFHPLHPFFSDSYEKIV